MSIHHLPESNTFFLTSCGSTYAFKVLDLGSLAHLYWGREIAPQNLDHLISNRGRCFSPNPVIDAPEPDGPKFSALSLDNTQHEFPAYGTSDYRSPALEVFQPATGSRIIDFRYKGYSIVPGKPTLEGLPATLAKEDDAQTLVIELVDKTLGLHAELLYTVFEKHPVITRSVRLINNGNEMVSLRRLLSCTIDFSSTFSNYNMIQLSGAWARERDLICAPLRPGTQSVESRRGASSHQHNPFIALSELGTNEEHGAVYGFNLVYSGNFLASVEVDCDGLPRVQIGINPFDFSWQLDAGASFQAPEAVLVFSPEGLGGMSRTLHRFYRQHLGASTWLNKPRPILINNWEATYFDFDAEKLERIAASGAELGIELFVLDDGWFGHRDDDHTSLGDWVVDRKKLPGGLEELAARINAKDMQFGLWFEPEMVSEDSDLYRAHPDWCLHVPNRPRTPGRQQYVLDFSRADVCEEIYQSIALILRTVPITYLKWDMNRHMTEIGSAALPPERQQETAHRYILGLYAMMDRFLKEFPEVLCEGCSGGGGRFDPGILHYMPQIWTSDNTDAISRLKIQYGTTIAYPLSTMGAHVSVVPNHCVGRVTPFDTRGDVALTGAFGYELDVSIMTDEDKAKTKEQTAFYKKVRTLLSEGDLYRLLSPFEGNEAAWIVVSPDRAEALVTHVNLLVDPNLAVHFIKVRGLDPQRTYRVEGTEERYRGDALMQIGLAVPLPTGDFGSTKWHLVSEPAV